jgi:radical SAM/Cys-rich protein
MLMKNLWNEEERRALFILPSRCPTSWKASQWNRKQRKICFCCCCSSSSADKPNTFDALLRQHDLQPLKRRAIHTVQVNIGLYCNMACSHCHVESSPSRKETMSPKVAERILQLISRTPSIQLLDITGGAPELHNMFRPLVLAASAMGIKVQDRCNLTVLWEPGQEDLAEFLALHQVDIVASLPCYEEANVRKQRGDGTFDKSIRALQLLNSWGYGRDGTRKLHLVYNPVEPQLPGNQSILEQKYKKELAEKFSIQFDKLFCITNMPIRRYGHDLKRRGKWNAYWSLLEQSFQPDNVQHVMCLDQVHISFDGSFYDCDFHYAVGLKEKYQRNIWQVDDLNSLCNNAIQTASHCLGCTAGYGSSCQGSLS